ncbi:hypothetical protein [Sphingomonas sp.]|uniref:hypothetical protein n=1 Tax=Sphingomonas sp. TaxID=28214 RepID=UPI003B3AFAA3
MTRPVAHSRPYDLGRGFSVEFKLQHGQLNAVWSPRVPHGRRGRQLLPAYKAARNRFLSSLTPDLGTIMVVDL